VTPRVANQEAGKGGGLEGRLNGDYLRLILKIRFFCVIPKYGYNEKRNNK
jgi:hypothetical protein